MKKLIIRLAVIIILTAVLAVIAIPALAANEASVTPAEVTAAAEAKDSSTGSRALAAGIAIGLAGLGGTIGMGLAIARSADGIARQPEAEGKIRTNLMLGLVFVETVVIYALIVAILVIFVL